MLPLELGEILTLWIDLSIKLKKKNDWPISTLRGCVRMIVEFLESINNFVNILRHSYTFINCVFVRLAIQVSIQISMSSLVNCSNGINQIIHIRVKSKTKENYMNTMAIRIFRYLYKFINYIPILEYLFRM